MTIYRNTCEFVGRVVADPEFQYTRTAGAPLAKLSVAVNRNFTDRDSGEPRETREYVDFKVWNRAAEQAGQHLTKGTLVFMAGELRTEKWTDQTSGQPRSRVFIHVRDSRNVVILDADGRALTPQPGEEEAVVPASGTPAPAPSPAPVVAPPAVTPPKRPAKRRPKADDRYAATAADGESLPF